MQTGQGDHDLGNGSSNLKTKNYQAEGLVKVIDLTS